MISLMRRADSEYAQCNFTFPIPEYVEFEANPDIVRSSSTRYLDFS